MSVLGVGTPKPTTESNRGRVSQKPGNQRHNPLWEAGRPGGYSKRPDGCGPPPSRINLPSRRGCALVCVPAARHPTAGWKTRRAVAWRCGMPATRARSWFTSSRRLRVAGSWRQRRPRKAILIAHQRITTPKTAITSCINCSPVMPSSYCPHTPTGICTERSATPPSQTVRCRLSLSMIQ